MTTTPRDPRDVLKAFLMTEFTGEPEEQLTNDLAAALRETLAENERLQARIVTQDESLSAWGTSDLAAVEYSLAQCEKERDQLRAFLKTSQEYTAAAEYQRDECRAKLDLAEAVVRAAHDIEGHAEECPVSAPGGRELPHGSFCDCGREKLGDALAAYDAHEKGET